MNKAGLSDTADHEAAITFTSLLAESHVIICAGSGGVGKTTTAAALAIQAARSGKRSIVVTIDPAKRLADALGLPGLAPDPVIIDEHLWMRSDDSTSGQLSAMMLDPKATFDALSPKQMLAGAINNYTNHQVVTLSSYGNKMAYVWGLNSGFTSTDAVYNHVFNRCRSQLCKRF